MSSTTESPQQLSETESVRTRALEKKIARLEAQLEAQVKTEKDDTEALLDQLENLEAVFEKQYEKIAIKDEQIAIKDTTILELQTALDNADRPRGSGDDMEVKDLRSQLHAYQIDLANVNADLVSQKEEVRKCQEYIRVLETHFHNIQLEAANILDIEAERIERVKSAFDSQRDQFDSFRQRFETSQKEQIETLQRDLETSQKDQFETLKRDLETSQKDQFDSFRQHFETSQKEQFDLSSRWLDSFAETLTGEIKVDTGALTKLEKSCDLAGTRSGASTTKSTPKTQGVATQLVQSSAISSTPPPPSQNPAKARKSTAELEILRLKNRKTLYSLAPSRR